MVYHVKKIIKIPENLKSINLEARTRSSFMIFLIKQEVFSYFPQKNLVKRVIRSERKLAVLI